MTKAGHPGGLSDASEPSRPRFTPAEEREIARVQELMDTRYIADLGPAGKGWGRREFLFISTTATVFAGLGFFVWPFIHSMNPAADVEAVATTDVDLSHIEPGQAITVVWRGTPVFIRHRTAKEIEAARAVTLQELPDPQPDDARVQKPEWLVLIGICDHLGCVPRGQRASDPKGEFGGWFCPCHGSHFDSSGRIRKGPAPTNMRIPPYTFTDNTSIRIG